MKVELEFLVLESREIVKSYDLPPGLILERRTVTKEGEYIMANCAMKQHRNHEYFGDDREIIAVQVYGGMEDGIV